ncbi:unnamed protein product [Vitrella brassicaformis CCMP3155]|uniref:Uncharacterized protein n=1 Tax=Vitrella brassicaformis (strain CCMP3155) TaxID=1169540 RepID=A0A0G4FTU3_VITBC|nr:unnamed protein product [Vitrella brassicaformis CCMP3155]|eukprot:CEM18314.1 unnamed protein product [Vitrella brassicaformis CCMP3155]
MPSPLAAPPGPLLPPSMPMPIPVSHQHGFTASNIAFSQYTASLHQQQQQQAQLQQGSPQALHQDEQGSNHHNRIVEQRIKQMLHIDGGPAPPAAPAVPAAAAAPSPSSHEAMSAIPSPRSPRSSDVHPYPPAPVPLPMPIAMPLPLPAPSSYQQHPLLHHVDDVSVSMSGPIGSHHSGVGLSSSPSLDSRGEGDSTHLGGGASGEPMPWASPAGVPLPSALHFGGSPHPMLVGRPNGVVPPPPPAHMQPRPRPTPLPIRPLQSYAGSSLHHHHHQDTRVPIHQTRIAAPASSANLVSSDGGVGQQMSPTSESSGPPSSVVDNQPGGAPPPNGVWQQVPSGPTSDFENLPKAIRSHELPVTNQYQAAGEASPGLSEWDTCVEVRCVAASVDVQTIRDIARESGAAQWYADVDAARSWDRRCHVMTLYFLFSTAEDASVAANRFPRDARLHMPHPPPPPLKHWTIKVSQGRLTNIQGPPLPSGLFN